MTNDEWWKREIARLEGEVAAGRAEEVEVARARVGQAAERLLGSAGPALAAIEKAKERLEPKPKKRWWEFWK